MFKNRLAFRELSRKVTVHVKNNTKIGCGAPFSYMIGFDKTDLIIDEVTEAPLTANLEAGFHALYVYKDIPQPQFVSDSEFDLLKVVKRDSVFGDDVYVKFQNPQYIPVTVKIFQTIAVDIKRHW